MVVINLLPWREYRDAYQKQQSQKFFLFSVTFALFILGVIHVFLGHMLEREHAYVLLLQNEKRNLPIVNSLKSETTDISRNAQDDPIHHLNAINNLFTVLGKKWQQNICFTEINREKEAILFVGMAETAEELTTFLTNWNVSHLFAAIKIEQLQYQEKQGMVLFRFRGQNSLVNDAAI